MSLPNENNLPSFNFIVDETYLHESQYPQPWLSTGPRSAQYSMPSPSTSARSAMTTPDPRFPDTSGFNQPNLFQQQFGIDPSLPFLAPPEHIPRDNCNMLARHLREGPWNPLVVMNYGQGLQCQPNLDYGSSRDGHGFDMGSVHDSGYGPSAYGSTSVKPTHSVVSIEPECTNQELSSDVILQNVSMEIASVPSEAPRTMHTRPEQVSNCNSQSGVHGKQLKCDHVGCDERFKCKSDYRKHKLKHDKPYLCGYPGCKRTKGFTTTNDRDRHRKSVHKVGLHTDGKSYKCASKGCRSKEKIWPRFDNFKQHVERMHDDENVTDLIKRSLQRPAESALARNAFSMTSMDNSLAFAGIGTEDAYTEGHQGETVSPTSLTVDQDVSPCAHGFTNNGFTTDIDQPVTQSLQSFPTTVDPCLRNVQEQAVNQRGPRRLQTRGELAKMREPTAKHVASKSVHLNDQSSQPSRRAPQTKADQQKVASQRASKTITEGLHKPVPSLSDPVGIDDLVQFVLNQAKKTAESEHDKSSQQNKGSTATQVPAEENSTDTLIKDRVLQVLSGLLKQSPQSASMLPCRSSQGSSSKKGRCGTCGYEARPCDLRKHIKRHKKPYGCTFPECYRRFGAKSDWKRHENSQHFQLEAFRCAQKIFPSGVTCGKYFRGPEQFKKHLEMHDRTLSGKQLQEKVKNCKIGKNYQVQFWCGFCCEIKPLAEKRNAAWDERFNHIAEHFDKDEKSIDEWICVEKNRTKRELEDEDRKKVQAESDERAEDVDAVGEIDDNSPPDVEMEIVPPPAAVTLPLQQTRHLTNPRKRQASADPMPPRKKQVLVQHNIYCCSCGSGPWNLIHASCQSCGRRFCGSCERVDDEVPIEGDLRG